MMKLIRGRLRAYWLPTLAAQRAAIELLVIIGNAAAEAKKSALHAGGAALVLRKLPGNFLGRSRLVVVDEMPTSIRLQYDRIA